MPWNIFGVIHRNTFLPGPVYFLFLPRNFSQSWLLLSVLICSEIDRIHGKRKVWSGTPHHSTSKIRSPTDVRSPLVSGIALRRRPVIREKADKYTPARVLEGKMPFRMAHGRSVDLPDGYDTQDSTRLEQSFAGPRANVHGCACQAWSLLSMKMFLKRGPVQA